MYILRYCSSSWFVLSIYLFICGWKAIHSFVFISNISFNSFINSTANYGPLFEITLSGNLCNFYILFLNNFVKPSTIIFSVIIIKCNIFKNLLYTTKIKSWFLDTSNFIIKFTDICCYSFSSIVFGLSFSTSISILFFIL